LRLNLLQYAESCAIDLLGNKTNSHVVPGHVSLDQSPSSALISVTHAFAHVLANLNAFFEQLNNGEFNKKATQHGLFVP
jgi:hypothetical protein